MQLIYVSTFCSSERGDSEGRLKQFLSKSGWSDDICAGPFAGLRDAEEALRSRGWTQDRDHPDHWHFSFDDTESLTVEVCGLTLVSSDRLPIKS
ncbi:MAG: hypothetical protein HY340_03535 [Candidatus Kerfeldbacteria bacterium]|nr:hypothetical protein [Candidatus Kerfeldbacteria bacterium]